MVLNDAHPPGIGKYKGSYWNEYYHSQQDEVVAVLSEVGAATEGYGADAHSSAEAHLIEPEQWWDGDDDAEAPHHESGQQDSHVGHQPVVMDGCSEVDQSVGGYDG